MSINEHIPSFSILFGTEKIVSGTEEWSEEYKQKFWDDLFVSNVDESLITDKSMVVVSWDICGNQMVDLFYDYDKEDFPVGEPCFIYSHDFSENCEATEETWIVVKNVAQMVADKYHIPVLLE